MSMSDEERSLKETKCITSGKGMNEYDNMRAASWEVRT